MSSNDRGFTLIECVMTLILLGILSAISVSVLSSFKYKAEQSALIQTNILAASSCIERIKAIEGSRQFTKKKNRQSISCSNASVKIIALKSTPEDGTANSGGNIRIEPTEDPDADGAPYYLIKATSGSVEFNYVVTGRSKK